MAKKTRRQKQRAASRRPAGPSPGAGPAGTAAPAGPVGRPAPAAVPRVEATEVEPAQPLSQSNLPIRRRLERVAPSGAAARPAARPGRGPANAAAMFQPLESEDAAIPFDRVPYVPADLRRVAMMAAAMVVLIIIAALVVSHLVT